MQYFRNTDIANTYHVSVRAVSNWIQATHNGRLDLTLHQENGRDYVANTARNIAIITKLVEERRKYRTTKAHKVVTPSPEFYTLFSPEQIVDIISNLEIHREIPRQYNYFDGGAVHWDDYAQRLAGEEDANILKSTIELINLNLDYIDYLVAGKKVNLIDIGPGNALPVKGLIKHLLARDSLARYTAIDISPEMIHIAESRIADWFKGEVKFNGEIRDIAYERITDILAHDMFTSEADSTVNIILFLGGTIGNFRSPNDVLRTIGNSMQPGDVLICSQKLDTPAARRYFDFNNQPGTKLSPNHKLVLDLLNLNESLYEVEAGFDSSQRERYIRLKVNTAVTIEFGGGRSDYPVHLNKDDQILLWRFSHRLAPQVLSQFDQAGFELLQASVTDDGEYLLNIHRVKLATP